MTMRSAADRRPGTARSGDADVLLRRWGAVVYSDAFILSQNFDRKLGHHAITL